MTNLIFRLPDLGFSNCYIYPRSWFRSVPHFNDFHLPLLGVLSYNPESHLIQQGKLENIQ